MARIGIYGGSFNPPHLGHMLAAREFCEKLSLDRVLLIPAAAPPHKVLSANSPAAKDRLEMTRIAAAQLPFAEVSDIELLRRGPSYTADTLDVLRERFPEDELFLLMGTDMFFSFENWYRPEHIAEIATIAVAHRSTDNEQKLVDHAQRLQSVYDAKVCLVQNAFLPYSSTVTRAMLAFGCGEEYLHSAVYQYIQHNGLYLTNAVLRGLPFDELSRVSLCLHDAKRVPHVIGCSQTAEALALRYGGDPEAARRAGILHDITKALGPEEQLKLCDRYGIILDNFQRSTPKLLHAKTGAVVAARVFGESDAIYEAIYWHTTGKADMSLLEKIIYLADYIEPNRNFDGVEELRHLAMNDLDAAMVRGLETTISYVSGRGGIIDKDSQKALRFLKERMHLS